MFAEVVVVVMRELEVEVELQDDANCFRLRLSRNSALRAETLNLVPLFS